MTGPKILVTGGGGQLGLELGLASPTAVVLSRRELDVTDREGVRDALEFLRPDVVVHAAAMTAVDRCEEFPELALQTNALGTRWVVEAADRTGARVVLLSTDYVFPGDGDRPLTEWDPTGPKSWYGRSKLGAEQELRPCDTVVRTSWLAGKHGPNIIRTVLSLAAEGAQLNFVDDQVGSPSFTFDVAASVLQLVDHEVSGVVHVVNEGQVSWFDYIREVLSAAGFSPDQVEPVATVDLDPPRLAPRPMYSPLDTAVLRAGGFDVPPPFRESLGKLINALGG